MYTIRHTYIHTHAHTYTYACTESEVRASVAFQVSKLASFLSKGLRLLAKQEAWDALVTGGYLRGLL
jgi:hypothetical protein